jgi:hypothetical protein
MLLVVVKDGWRKMIIRDASYDMEPSGCRHGGGGGGAAASASSLCSLHHVPSVCILCTGDRSLIINKRCV